MNLTPLKNAVTSKVGRQVLTVKKHSPTILFAGGVVGVVGATVLACRATLKLEDVLEDTKVLDRQVVNLDHPDYSDEDKSQDRVILRVQAAKKIAKLYAPAFGVGVISIAALTGSHLQLTRRNAAVMAAYAALDRGFNEYRDRVREDMGEEKDLEFRHGSRDVEEVVVDKDGNNKKELKKGFDPGVMPSVYARIFDETSPEWQREVDYNRAFLSAQQNYFNEMLRARGHVFLNEVYKSLGFEHTKAGAITGWVMDNDGDNYVDFGIFRDDTRAAAFINGPEKSILLDFNVDGIIYDLI